MINNRVLALIMAIFISLSSANIASSQTSDDKNKDFNPSDSNTWQDSDGNYKPEAYSNIEILNSDKFDWSKADMPKIQDQQILEQIKWQKVPDNKVAEITHAGSLSAVTLQNMGPKFGSLKPEVRNWALLSTAGIEAKGVTGNGYIVTFKKNADNSVALTNSLDDPFTGGMKDTIIISANDATKFTVEYIPEGGFKLTPKDKGIVNIGEQDIQLEKGSIAKVQGESIAIEGKGRVVNKDDPKESITNNAGTVNLQRNEEGKITRISSENGNVLLNSIRGSETDSTFLKGKFEYNSEDKKVHLEEGGRVDIASSKENKAIAEFSAEAQKGQGVDVQLTDKSSKDIMSNRQPNTVFYNPDKKEVHAFGIAAASLTLPVENQKMQMVVESSNPDNVAYMSIDGKPKIVVSHNEGTKVEVRALRENYPINYLLTIGKDEVDPNNLPLTKFSKQPQIGVIKSFKDAIGHFSNSNFDRDLEQIAPVIQVVKPNNLPNEFSGKNIVENAEKSVMTAVMGSDNIYTAVAKDPINPTARVEVGLGIREKQLIDFNFLDKLRYKEDPFPEQRKQLEQIFGKEIPEAGEIETEEPIAPALEISREKAAEEKYKNALNYLKTNLKGELGLTSDNKVVCTSEECVVDYGTMFETFRKGEAVYDFGAGEEGKKVLGLYDTKATEDKTQLAEKISPQAKIGERDAGVLAYQKLHNQLIEEGLLQGKKLVESGTYGPNTKTALEKDQKQLLDYGYPMGDSCIANLCDGKIRSDTIVSLEVLATEGLDISEIKAASKEPAGTVISDGKVYSRGEYIGDIKDPKDVASGTILPTENTGLAAPIQVRQDGTAVSVQSKQKEEIVYEFKDGRWVEKTRTPVSAEQLPLPSVQPAEVPKSPVTPVPTPTTAQGITAFQLTPTTQTEKKLALAGYELFAVGSSKYAYNPDDGRTYPIDNDELSDTPVRKGSDEDTIITDFINIKYSEIQLPSTAKPGEIPAPTTYSPPFVPGYVIPADADKGKITVDKEGIAHFFNQKGQEIGTYDTTSGKITHLPLETAEKAPTPAQPLTPAEQKIPAKLVVDTEDIEINLAFTDGILGWRTAYFNTQNDEISITRYRPNKGNLEELRKNLPEIYGKNTITVENKDNDEEFESQYNDALGCYTQSISACLQLRAGDKIRPKVATTQETGSAAPAKSEETSKPTETQKEVKINIGKVQMPGNILVYTIPVTEEKIQFTRDLKGNWNPQQEAKGQGAVTLTDDMVVKYLQSGNAFVITSQLAPLEESAPIASAPPTRTQASEIVENIGGASDDLILAILNDEYGQYAPEEVEAAVNEYSKRWPGTNMNDVLKPSPTVTPAPTIVTYGNFDFFVEEGKTYMVVGDFDNFEVVEGDIKTGNFKYKAGDQTVEVKNGEYVAPKTEAAPSQTLPVSPAPDYDPQKPETAGPAMVEAAEQLNRGEVCPISAVHAQAACTISIHATFFMATNTKLEVLMREDLASSPRGTYTSRYNPKGEPVQNNPNFPYRNDNIETYYRRNQLWIEPDSGIPPKPGDIMVLDYEDLDRHAAVVMEVNGKGEVTKAFMKNYLDEDNLKVVNFQEWKKQAYNPDESRLFQGIRGYGRIIKPLGQVKVASTQ